jgi:hypothetical protein
MMAHVTLESTVALVDTSPDMLDMLAVTIDCRDKQTIAAGGLEFTLGIANQSDDPIHLHNPYDLITYLLTDSDGGTASPQRPPSRTDFHVDASIRRLREHYLPVVQIHAGRTITLAEELERDEIEIAPRAAYSYLYRIRERLTDSSGQDQSQERVALTPGIYRLIVTQPLIASGGISATRLLQSPPIPVTLD